MLSIILKLLMIKRLKDTLFQPFVFLPFAGGILVVILMAFAFWNLGYFAQAESSRLPNADHVLGQSLSQFKLLDDQRKEISISEISDKRILLVFLSTGCGACKKEVKSISEKISKLSTVPVYGISFETPESIESFIQENNIKFPILRDTDGNLFKTLKINYFPTECLIENGTVVKAWVGSSSDENALMQKLVF